MANDLIFNAWQRSGLFDSTELTGARLSGTLPLQLEDTATGQQSTGNAPFTLMAAADIGGLKPGAIRHMAPAPGVNDAETTKYVHIDFYEKDLPWRYTPAKNGGNLKPWLVLLVGREADIKVDGGFANVAANVLGEHDPQKSHLFAHTQTDEAGVVTGRILSPCKLLPQQQYMAVLVPAFGKTGTPLWTVNGDVVTGPSEPLRAFHYWRFATAEAGDFETLAAALRIPPAGDIGKAKLYYRRNAVNEELEVYGAITSLQVSAPDQAALNAVHDDLAILTGTLNEERVISLPDYGRPWLADPAAHAVGWPANLNKDARYRSITGLGTWMGVEGQEALMDAAVVQAGALHEAAALISGMALGIWAQTGLWGRHLGTGTPERLQILGPMMARMLASEGGLLLDAVTSGSSPLAPGLFSATAQRLLRQRSPHTRHVNGGIQLAEAITAANKPAPTPDQTPETGHVNEIIKDMGLQSLEDIFQLDIKWIMAVIEELFRILEDFTKDYNSKRKELETAGRIAEIPEIRIVLARNLGSKIADTLQARLEQRQLPCQGWDTLSMIANEAGLELLAFCEQLLVYENRREQFREDLYRALARCMGKHNCEKALTDNTPYKETACDLLLNALDPPPPPQERPVNLDKLAAGLHAALDPRKPDAPARIRLCKRLEGVDCMRLIPAEFPVGIDYPTWDLLRQYDQEWLLPGAKELPKDSITALQTNPAFIDAYMVGINTQFFSEMRWRDLAAERTGTPLRMFWGQMDYTQGKRLADIQPLAEWAKAPAEEVGALSHQSIQPHDADNTTGSRLVIAFHSDLFRRYPNTLVYLVKPAAGNAPDGELTPAAEHDLDELLKAPPQLDMPAGADPVEWRKNRKYFGPVFPGKLAPDITFFIFDVTPADLSQYWLVLDEPPAELRFRNTETADNTNGAAFASAALDLPTRWLSAELN